MSNFAFIQIDFPTLHDEAAQAEQLARVAPAAAAMLCRVSLEKAVNWLYDHDSKLVRPWRADLNTLLHEPSFQNLFSPAMFREINLIRKTGNIAAHGDAVVFDDVLAMLKYLFRFLRFVAIYYGKTRLPEQVFDESLLTDLARASGSPATTSDADALVRELEAKNAALREAEDENRKLIESNATLLAELNAQKSQHSAERVLRMQAFAVEVAVPPNISEAETRRRYIDISLRECGWNHLVDGRDKEYPVTGMPTSTNPSGKGFVDYVLWGDDGLPLAVVEAKKSMVDARQGREQAKLYADSLQAMHGQRPIIFYTNGFETYLWDDAFYPERQVQGFYTKSELQLMLDRRGGAGVNGYNGTARLDLREFRVNEAIAGRPYQIEAVKRVAETFVTTNQSGQLRGRGRKALLVMATGSGKTRTAAAIVDMLMQSRWVKRVLFLADRNALVTQAKNAFNEYLPQLSAIDLTCEAEDVGTRLVFSTYPTMLNRIDHVNEGERFYGVGHFDLIIVDEAHRSVYQKYKAIFDYFDALLVGLTATPKTAVDRNTYELFGIEDHNPTFAYELDKAVEEGFLVPPKAISVPIKFPRDGIKYGDLSAEEKEEWEEKFGDPTVDSAPDEIGGAALNEWLFNTDTVDKVLAHLMSSGIKVQGGDRLGKTIIFAKSHRHAEFIRERFDVNYPEYSGSFMSVIDNYESKAQSLLTKFTNKHADSDPQIAVSVDMMDTGVDAVRVVNLVFFKLVRSSTKFWQMVGRGTRPCPNLFGKDMDKTEFVIFDYCGNLEYFDANPEGVESKAVRGLSQQTFEVKLELALLIRGRVDSNDEERALAEAFINELHATVKLFDRNRAAVRMKLRRVEEYSDATRWQNLSRSDMQDINSELSNLVLPIAKEDELARRFDVLILNYQLALFSNAHSSKYQNQIRGVAHALLKKQNIPAVAKQVPMLTQLQQDDFWQSVNVVGLEPVRLSLRDLMKYLDTESQDVIYTHFEDTLNVDEAKEFDLVKSSGQLKSYKERVESYVRNNSHHLVIRRLQTNKPISRTEIDTLEKILFEGDLGTREDYARVYGEKPLGVFIRNIVGLDVNAAQAVFAEFIQAGHLSADQMTFINNIIRYLTINGVIDKNMLFTPPFTDLNDQGLLGVFDEIQSKMILDLLSQVSENAITA
ncbi:DEAD/DEAH box helicase family protein [Hydromonas duriensis]|uniref:Type I restriction enzyme R subunit n=1 Tax=Hydromonas duriensis TaxID=1527608 RepID=A0A4R6Y3U7_9BURK|nr:DEAD/DEAH box helicase family protein [Hydromonas duriensis]TDR31051.1 type I restriction enzyme R subunit [Hydromonas duriensis]